MQTSTQAVRARTDEPFLERFIEAHEAFVLRCASRHAGFAVTRSDDEYSVALLAFYEAIKGYDPASGPFGAYASLVIGRRLADHYRSQHRFDAETPLAPQTFDGTVDRESADAAMQQAVAEQMSEAKPVSAQDEIEAANTVFEKYGFAFYDLAASSPKSDKTRRSCAAAVGTLLHSPVLFASMQSAHSLPIKALAQQCGVSARTITRHRDYIVAAALLIDGDYPILCTYLQTMRKEAEHACDNYGYSSGEGCRARGGRHGSPCRREEQSGRTGDSDSGEAPQTVEKAADLGGVRGCPVRHGDHRRVRRV